VTAPRLALATCAELPGGDPDDAHLVAELEARGVEHAWLRWDDPGAGWRDHDAVVIRSPWDYARRRDEFLGWAARQPRVLNPFSVLAWNTDKRYLGELAAAGLPVVETAFVDRGAPLPALEREVVLKPTVSAGSKDTARRAPGDEEAARAHLAAIHASGRTAMVQPYLDAVDAAGETALLFFGGRYSHAIRKGPLLPAGGAMPDGLFAQEDIRPREPSPGERAAAEQVAAWVAERFGVLPYMRIDLLPSDAGPVLLELELTEPSLFFAHDEGAAARYVDAVLGAL
jgi:glutathione synthase/RimK-type ligase-like ATP-grasp enzyme